MRMLPTHWTGDGEGEIQYQNFNACEAKFTIEGKSVHPGSAKHVMINAVLLACEMNQMIPRYETRDIRKAMKDSTIC